MQSLLQLIHRHKAGDAVGIYSVCSAHPWVLESALQVAKERKTAVLIEATSNQVNQFGGYTGMQPRDFRNKIFEIANKLDFPTQQIWLGGDHLGPNVWQEHSAEQAMTFSETLIYDYVKAGFRKIHLDCSMPCADDAAPLTDEIVAQRAARLCTVAERSWRENGGEAPVYVIGTEVPTPGGVKSALTKVQITSANAAATTLNIHQSAWHNAGLIDVWPRVIALVVQPGVEFSHHQVEHYQVEKAKALSHYIENHPHIVYEAHSTDYQTPQSYQNLVRDHFAILKVGPALTFALREGLFALDKLDREWNGKQLAAYLSETLEQVMLEQPKHWQPYYQGSAHQQYIDRQYSLNDRIRYYWTNPKVEAAVEKLLTNLRQRPVPLSMLSQYLPEQMAAINAGRLSATDPKEWVKDKIRSVLMHYAIACETKTEGAIVL
ncbi:D-tagatose-bisphosphate aldolase, class II, non-catalytic subunit [Arsenophonus apicola]|uniref:D-tagatose-bisphosphate aldolase, class II, non-catalytic subunit n=1 Tax=Arsenophonus apicola TaxID=2879119 RepID=A0ABY8P485_9GAMM|nr:D-tagatose-bisphosphate aldolase, class II, non-catalytic subunit [Arsenophonus apicola]WGO84303.1 D-tagatose-bisphosphate aldolase, class II, non-catalytic subunit [Arsenophonus apicola]